MDKQRRLYNNKGKEERDKRKMEPEIAKIEKRDRQKDVNNIGSRREGDREGEREGEGRERERERERGERERERESKE
jgi:hypothetical protein